jgi:aspartate racemase
MIGILGGMGPESTAYTYKKMITYCQEKYGAKLDSDFPPIFIYSMPIPDVVEEGSDDAVVLALLEAGIGKLKAVGSDFCIIPCNTVQGFVPALRKNADLLSIVEETLKEAKDTGISRWGILCTEVTLRKGYYQRSLSDSGLEVLEPTTEQQKEVTAAIRDILAGNRKAEARERLLTVASAMRNNGAEGIILACTDLPIVLQKAEGLVLLDTVDIIARAAVDYYKLKT